MGTGARHRAASRGDIHVFLMDHSIHADRMGTGAILFAGTAYEWGVRLEPNGIAMMEMTILAMAVAVTAPLSVPSCVIILVPLALLTFVQRHVVMDLRRLWKIVTMATIMTEMAVQTRV